MRAQAGGQRHKLLHDFKVKNVCLWPLLQRVDVCAQAGGQRHALELLLRLLRQGGAEGEWFILGIQPSRISSPASQQCKRLTPASHSSCSPTCLDKRPDPLSVPAQQTSTSCPRLHISPPLQPASTGFCSPAAQHAVATSAHLCKRLPLVGAAEVGDLHAGGQAAQQLRRQDYKRRQDSR